MKTHSQKRVIAQDRRSQSTFFDKACKNDQVAAKQVNKASTYYL
jgi:hypothetical protein